MYILGDGDGNYESTWYDAIHGVTLGMQMAACGESLLFKTLNMLLTSIRASLCLPLSQSRSESYLP